MSQSSDELILQVMVIAGNKRPAERFLVLLRCGLPQRRRFFYQNVQPTSGSMSPNTVESPALYLNDRQVTIRRLED